MTGSTERRPLKTRGNATPARRPRHLLSAILCAYGAAATIVALAVATTGERWWPVALAAVFAPWWLTPAPVLLAVTLVSRRQRAVVALGVASLVWGIWYGRQLMPALPATCGSGSAGAPTLRLATFNVGAGRTKWRSLALDIVKLDADIVGLQELSDENAERLDAALADAFPHRFMYGGGTLGMGVLSRFPMTAVERLPSSAPGRDTLRTVVRTPAGPLAIIVGHPRPPRRVPGLDGWAAYRQDPGLRDDIRRIAQAAIGNGPSCVIGDLNAPERHSALKELRRAGLEDVFPRAGRGFGFTWPVHLVFNGVEMPPLVRLDHVWCAADVQPIRAWLGRVSAGSDHRPVVAEVRITRTASPPFEAPSTASAPAARTAPCRRPRRPPRSPP